MQSCSGNLLSGKLTHLDVGLDHLGQRQSSPHALPPAGPSKDKLPSRRVPQSLTIYMTEKGQNPRPKCPCLVQFRALDG
jgi:hypothetical protein